MSMLHSVPFYGNTPDNTHCFQACLKMVLAYVEPKSLFSWEKLDGVTGKVSGMWTWPMQTLLWLYDRGCEVRDIEKFDYALFAERGENYLIQIFGEEVAKSQKEHSDLLLEQSRAQTFVDHMIYDRRIPTYEDITELINQGFLQILNVNSCALDQTPGYEGHAVLVIGYDENGLILHDPGLPHRPSCLVPHDVFMKAWAYPTEKAQNCMAIRLTK